MATKKAKRIVATKTCPMTGDVTVFLDNDTTYTIGRRDIQRSAFGLEGILSEIGLLAANLEDPNERVDVIQYGRKVGELPVWWNPAFAKSRNFLYDYRPNELTLIDGKWVAAKNLGASDLDLLVGFVRKDQPHDQ